LARPTRKKGKIEEAAIRLLAGKGLARTTIRDIAAAAGVGEGALYRHWAGKDDMAWQLYCREVSAFTAAFEPILSRSAGPLRNRLLDAVRFVYRFYGDQPDRLVFVLLTRQGFPQRRILDESIDPDHAVIRFIRAEMAAGNVPPGDPVLRMAMVRGVVLEPVLMHRYGRLKTAPIDLAEQVAAACVRILER